MIPPEPPAAPLRSVAVRLFRVNVTFRGMRVGDLVEIDPELWQGQIARGYLSEVVDDHARVLAEPERVETTTTRSRNAAGQDIVTQTVKQTFASGGVISPGTATVGDENPPEYVLPLTDPDRALRELRGDDGGWP